MRLRLCIHRNQLPAVSTLWPVSDVQLKNTIAQLLEQVNNTFPLEADTWGLEHYSVSIGGYECLHYHELGAVCKDEDEIVIRPLQYVDVRARTLTGRDQVSVDGRHLVDGVPFGRPLLRGVVRPEVRIPPRKKRRLEIDFGKNGNVLELEDEEEEANSGAFVRLEDPEEDGDDDDEEDEEGDEDFEMEDAVSEGETSSAESSSDDDDDDDDDDDSSVASSDTGESTSDSDENTSDESWDGFESESKSAASPVKKSAPDAKAASSSHATDELKTNSVPSGADTHVLQKDNGPLQPLGSKRKQPSDDTSRDTNQERNEGKRVKLSPPEQGAPRTKERNVRRRDQKRLNHLKRAGILPENANLAALREWEEGNSRDKPNDTTPKEYEISAGPGASMTPDNPDGLGHTTDATEKDAANERSDHLPPKPPGAERFSRDSAAKSSSLMKAKQAAKIEEQRQQLLDAIASGGVDVTSLKQQGKRDASDTVNEDEDDNDEPPDELSAREAPARTETSSNGMEDQNTLKSISAQNANAEAGATKAVDMVPASVARRSKLDLAGSKRLLFGSLGVRVPKTQADKDALQKKLAGRPMRNVAQTEATREQVQADAVQPSGAGAEQPEEEDTESWRDKIELSAVECSDEGVTLSTPPFPFHQRWDPQYQRKKTKGRNSKQHMALQKRQKLHGQDGDMDGQYFEQYDKYNADGNGDALDYDDAVEDEEYWEEGALLDGEDEEGGVEDAAAQQLLDEAADSQQPQDDFPPLPDDIASLPLLTETEAQKNDFLVYKELTCSAATSWQPTMLTRTAQLLDKDDNGWTIKLALRDLRPKEYDDEGNRVYHKFEMEGLSDDEGEGDDRERTVQWTEMVEPRLLQRT